MVAEQGVRAECLFPNPHFCVCVFILPIDKIPNILYFVIKYFSLNVSIQLCSHLLSQMEKTHLCGHQYIHGDSYMYAKFDRNPSVIYSVK